jgi:hypothetical protein
MKPHIVSLAIFLAVAGLALVMLGSGYRDWRLYALLFLIPSGAWSILYGYVYAREEFYYYGGWGLILIVGGLTAAVSSIVGSLAAAGLALIVVALIVVVAEAVKK